jgi:glutamine synthetase
VRALLAAGLAGIEQGMELEPEMRGDNYHNAGAREIPKTLREAADLLEGSGMLLRAPLGDEVVDHYTRAARWEVEEHDRVVTDWERKRLLERGRGWAASGGWAGFFHI